MGKSLENQIRTLMENYGETPSSSAWDALSGQLDALHAGTSAAAQGIQAAQSAQGWWGHFLGSAAAKLSIGAVLVGGVTAAALLWKPGHETSAGNDVPETEAFPTDTASLSVAAEEEAAVAETYEASTQPTQEQSFSNTTFNEGVPYHLLTEQSESQTDERSIPETSIKSDGVKKATEQKTEKAPSLSPEKPKQTEAESKAPAMEEETALPQPDIRIPNVISPNGDNINDYLVIENIHLTEKNQLVIYNRNGRIIYEKRAYDNSWNAENLPEGIYLYWFSFEYGGKEFMRQGSIRVVR